MKSGSFLSTFLYIIAFYHELKTHAEIRLRGGKFKGECSNDPCLNGGTCFEVKPQNDFACLCVQAWTGKRCQIKDLCSSSPCRNGGTCQLDENYNADCSCLPGFVGKKCEKFCRSNYCKNDGICTLDGKGDLKCSCQSDFSGLRCDSVIDKCLIENPCLNGATCVNKRGTGVACKCNIGYAGEHCQRPCRDIYKSCSLWDSENRCDWARHITRFFDVNCAQSCHICQADVNKVARDDSLILPPILEPFSFMVGRWKTRTNASDYFPTDFFTATQGYDEILQFHISEVTMFGTPSINYSSISTNVLDANDVRSSLGFLTLKPATEPIKTFLMATDNEGVASIEEGTLKDGNLLQEINNVFSRPEVHHLLPKASQRAFKKLDNGQSLQETVLKYDQRGRAFHYEKIYQKMA